MREVTKLLLLTALAVLLATAFAACGGDDSGETTTASTPTTTEETGEATAPEDRDPAKAEKGAGDDRPDATERPDDSDSSSGESHDDSSPSQGESSGKGSASFRTPGGDNSIQDYGKESPDPDLEAATATLSAFLDARAEGDWAEVCKQVAAATLKPLEQLAKRAPNVKSGDCSAILEALLGASPPSSRANTMGEEGIASLRAEGDRSFALYHGTDGVDYVVPMVREGGVWKVGSLAPSELS